jgi:beta-lactamase superfamily II metal-dependent hydrolase
VNRLVTLFLLTGVCYTPAYGQSGKTLDIYFIDTEGGHSTLYVTPSGESLLIDAGNPGTRDADRIMAALDDAGLKHVDYLVLTHYHVDHIGGVKELASRVPIKHFVDHGPTVEEPEQVAGFQDMYKELWSKADHVIGKPGAKLPMLGIEALVVTSAGEVLKRPLPGAGRPNPACTEFKLQAENTDPENRQSLGILFTYGKFRTINLGDFVWNAEPSLMCPNNPIGRVDLYMVSHHGTNQSGSEPLVHGLMPRVAVMDNGPRKGGADQTYRVLYSSPGLEDLWQLHWSYPGGLERNPAGLFIANIEDPTALAAFLTAPPPAPGAGRGARGGLGGRGGHAGQAFWIKASAHNDGSFTVTNSRNGFSKTYPQARER